MKVIRDVVMLSTDEKASNNGLVINPSTDQIQYNDTITRKGAEYYTEVGFTYNHIYITSNEDIKEGDWCIQNRNYLCKITCNQDRTQQGLKKIIATTDNLTFDDGYNSWFIPSPSDGFIKKFIEKYNAGTPITEVMVEYEGHCGLSGIECHTFYNRNQDCNNCNVIKANAKLKVDSNNCITITAVKDSWTREEVEKIIHDICGTMYKENTLYPPQSVQKWIEQNL